MRRAFGRWVRLVGVGWCGWWVVGVVTVRMRVCCVGVYVRVRVVGA
jgi:hypothetical protein